MVQNYKKNAKYAKKIQKNLHICKKSSNFAHTKSTFYFFY